MAKNFDAKEAARRAMADVSRTQKTFAVENLLHFVLMFVSYIMLELESNQKSLYHNIMKGDYLKAATSQAQKGRYIEKSVSDYAALAACLKDLYDLMWKLANEDEAHYIIDRLTSNDMPFAQRFFYGNDLREPNIALIRTKLNFELGRTYNVVIDPYELSQLLYLNLMENDWANLRTFNYQGSIYIWLETVGRRLLVKQLNN